MYDLRGFLGERIDWLDGHVVGHRVYWLCRLISWLFWPDEPYDRDHWKATRHSLSDWSKS